GVGLGGDRGEERLGRGQAGLEAERAVAVVGVEPVVARAQGQPRGDEHGLVARARNLEEDFVLPLELNLLVVNAPRQVHRAVDADKLVAAQASVLARLNLGRHDFYLNKSMNATLQTPSRSLHGSPRPSRGGRARARPRPLFR